MGIKKVVVFFTTFTLLGCSSNSNISVNICNQSGIDKTDIILNWQKGEKKFTVMHNGDCEKVKLTNLIGENQLNLVINKQKYPIDVYFESHNYQGSININLIGKNKIKITSNVNLN